MPSITKDLQNIKIPHIAIRDIRPRHIRLSIVDLLAVLLFGMLGLCYLQQPSAVADVEFNKVATIAFAYSVGRIVISQSSKYVGWLLLAVTAAWCCYEAVLGLLQVFGCRTSNNNLYACTGSFFNPGPFGGFLAVCVSMLVATLSVTKSKVWRYIAGGTIFIVVVILPSTMSRAGLLGLGCSMAVLAFSVEKWRNFIRKYWYAILLLSIIAGVGAYLFKKNSANGRMFMNKISVQTMLGNGLTGAGLGMYTGVYGRQQHDYFANQIEFRDGVIDISAINERERLTCGCPERSFNEFLGIGVEAGPVAMLLFVAIVVLSVVRLLKQKSPFAYGLITLSIFAFFSYPFDILEFQILLAIFFAFGATSESDGNVVGTSIAIVSVVLIIFQFAIQNSKQKRREWAEAQWSKTEYWYNQECYNYMVEYGNSLMPKLTHYYRFLFEYGQALNKEGQYAKSDSVLMLGASISSDPMFWNVLGNNSLAQGRYREAEERYRRAFVMVPNRLYPLCLLAKLYDAEGDTVKFLNISNQIDDFKAKIESTNTKKLRNEISKIKSKYTK